MSFSQYLSEQLNTHPEMAPRDVFKLCYQAARGAEHLLRDTTVAEGYFAAEMTMELAKKYNISMPITEVCYGILYENLPLMRSVEYLMTRPFGAE